MSRFAGLVILQRLFQALDLRVKLRRCFAHLDDAASYQGGTLFLLLVVQMLLGCGRLGEVNLLRDEPVVHRVVGLWRLPSVSTMSRLLSETDQRSVTNMRQVSGELVLERMAGEQLRVVTLDFDWTVQSTKGHAEGTAVRFNKKKRGARSYC